MNKLKDNYVDGQPLLAEDVNKTNAAVNEIIKRVGGRGVQVSVSGNNGRADIQLDGVINVKTPEYSVEGGELRCAVDEVDDGELLLVGGRVEDGTLLL